MEAGENGPGTRPPPIPHSPGYGGIFLRSFLTAGCATVLAPFLLFLALAIIVWLAIGSRVDEASRAWSEFYPGAGNGPRRVVLREGEDKAGDIAVIRIQGEITGGGSPLDGDGLLAEASEQLRAAAGDARVKAVLLQIDSPGGGLAASDQLHHEVEKLGRTGKPVVAWAGGVMASGGYYLAAAASGIMAGPTAVVGSIGVVMNHFQAAGLLRWLGIRADPIISGPRKDIGSPFREMTREEREILQARVDDSHRRFVALVAKGRKLPPEKVEELAGGDVFSAEEARENGLVDRIGYVDDALEWLEELSGGRGMRVIGYRRPPSLYDLVGEIGEAGAAAFWKGSLAELEPAPLMGF